MERCRVHANQSAVCAHEPARGPAVRHVALCVMYRSGSVRNVAGSAHARSRQQQTTSVFVQHAGKVSSCRCKVEEAVVAPPGPVVESATNGKKNAVFYSRCTRRKVGLRFRGEKSHCMRVCKRSGGCVRARMWRCCVGQCAVVHQRVAYVREAAYPRRKRHARNAMNVAYTRVQKVRSMYRQAGRAACVLPRSRCVTGGAGGEARVFHKCHTRAGRRCCRIYMVLLSASVIEV